MLEKGMQKWWKMEKKWSQNGTKIGPKSRKSRKKGMPKLMLKFEAEKNAKNHRINRPWSISGSIFEIFQTRVSGSSRGLLGPRSRGDFRSIFGWVLIDFVPIWFQNVPQMLPAGSRNGLEGIWKATWKQKKAKDNFKSILEAKMV